jgi:putative spermidine/putrescine transport system permease protein
VSVTAQLSRWWLVAVVGVVIVYLLVPLVAVLAGSLTATTFITLPPEGLSLQWYETALSDSAYVAAIRTSLFTGLAVIPITIAIGIPTAYAITRFRFRGRSLLTIMTLAPIIIPELVIAIALYQVFYNMGLGRSFGILVIGHSLICLPFMIRAITASLRGVDPNLEEAARSLGASGPRAFASVTLPLLRAGLFAGAVFVFVISLDLFLVSQLLSDQATLPVELWQNMRFGQTPETMALGSLLILLTVPTIFVITKTIGLESFSGIGRA